jgi:ubiquinone/menaquinone biosynthesis C-methylase UbiE
MSSHEERIREQFTRQAAPFAALRLHTQEQSLELLRAGLALTGHERVLDVGCGPGLVVRHLAPHAAHVVGLDATPAMLAKAREVCAALPNVRFEEGTMEALPFPDASFDAVVTRYTFHHVLDPAAALAEMVRVCRPGGRVVVCDAAPRASARAAYDAWEKLRDPSHASAWTPDELTAVMEGALEGVSVTAFRLDADVEDLLAACFPVEGGLPLLRAAMRADVGVDAMDLDAREIDGRLRMAFPILVLAGRLRP